MGSCHSSYSIPDGGVVVIKDGNDAAMTAQRRPRVMNHACPSTTNTSKNESDSSHGRPCDSDDTADLTHVSSGGSLHEDSSSHGHSSFHVLDSLIQSRELSSDSLLHIEIPSTRIEDVYHGVHDGPVLGEGTTGIVRQVTHKDSGKKFAVKCLDLELMDSERDLQQLKEEISIMAELHHDNIIQLHQVYEDETEIYLIEELCGGKDLFDRLDDEPYFEEKECAKIIKQMLCAVRYLHSKGIIHRDLKLENVCFSSDSQLKLIDFGLSKHFLQGQVQHEAVGTPYTVAPEVIQCRYDEKCDIWAIGCIAYFLLSGVPPFGGCGGPESLMTLRSNILQGRFAFGEQEVLGHVSSEGRDFIKSLLEMDPKNRPTAKEAEQHAWLRREWS